MKLEDVGEGEMLLLFVGRSNLHRVVRHIAPDLVLIPRSKFEKIAVSMLSIVEEAANDGRTEKRLVAGD